MLIYKKLKHVFSAVYFVRLQQTKYWNAYICKDANCLSTELYTKRADGPLGYSDIVRKPKLRLNEELARLFKLTLLWSVQICFLKS